MLVVIIESELLKRPCTILSSFIHWLKFLSALEIWGRSGIGHFAFVCSVPYPLKICKAEGYLVLLQNVHANVAIFMLTKENRKDCNKTKTPPTSLLGHRGLSWLLPFFIDPGLKGFYWFFYFSPCERERSAKGWKQFTKQWGREKGFLSSSPLRGLFPLTLRKIMKKLCDHVRLKDYRPYRAVLWWYHWPRTLTSALGQQSSSKWCWALCLTRVEGVELSLTFC